MDLSNDETLRGLWNGEYLKWLNQESVREWVKKYETFLDTVSIKIASRDISPTFHKMLWNDNPISSTGQGHVNVDRVFSDQEINSIVVEFSFYQTLPWTELINEFESDVHSLKDIVSQCCKKTPWLKIQRLMAALVPGRITCVANWVHLKQLARALKVYDPAERHSFVRLHFRILEKLHKAIPELNVVDKQSEWVKRSVFSWYLYTRISKKPEASVEPGDTSGVEVLKFMRPEMKRRGVAAINGYMDSVVQILKFVENGVTRQEALDQIASLFPNLKTNSVSSYLNVVKNELGLIKTQNDLLYPNERGEELLEHGDYNVLAPYLLTEVLGFERILWDLQKQTTLDRRIILESLQKHVPSWSSNFMPSTLLMWSESLGLVTRNQKQVYQLTERGQEWAELLNNHEPAPLIVVQEGVQLSIEIENVEDGEDIPVQTKSLQEILSSFRDLPFAFSEKLLKLFYTGLHTFSRKHFVLLSGLSGTGKSVLAKAFANVYHDIPFDEDNAYYLCIPVQPDWVDPTALLGYLNPFTETPTYVRTPCLDFLLHANQHPEKAHFLCLDEMNIARVELYFATFLSAMESSSRLRFHQEDISINGVIPSIPWPSNLFIIGTVNMDETTHAFSDKVLDRGMTLEFWDVDVERFGDVFKKNNSEIQVDLIDEITEFCAELIKVLQPIRLHFGYRTMEEMIRLVHIYETAEPDKNKNVRTEILDEAVYMKVLPRLRGEDRPRVLEAFANLETKLQTYGLQKSARRVKEMWEELRQYGTVRFWRS